jgi:hypothetical protein
VGLLSFLLPLPIFDFEWTLFLSEDVDALLIRRYIHAPPEKSLSKGDSGDMSAFARAVSGRYESESDLLVCN